MHQQLKQFTIDEAEDSSLLDCYRIALDFGIPAALKAYEKLALVSEYIETESVISFDKKRN
ncbi:MAG TPA: hypothetical protein EYQ42_10930 [Thiotrichaceae bacterium]|jgi:hypothetical protein|nr:hypothetical protein [Thiotrichaceae bacterium]HIM06916.1 hypothetical protein [Gammaproteobacteria bacterium]